MEDTVSVIEYVCTPEDIPFTTVALTIPVKVMGHMDAWVYYCIQAL